LGARRPPVGVGPRGTARTQCPTMEWATMAVSSFVAPRAVNGGGGAKGARSRACLAKGRERRRRGQRRPRAPAQPGPWPPPRSETRRGTRAGARDRRGARGSSRFSGWGYGDNVWFEDRWMIAPLCDERLTMLCGLILG
jgi:hypothetical protein